MLRAVDRKSVRPGMYSEVSSSTQNMQGCLPGLLISRMSVLSTVEIRGLRAWRTSSPLDSTRTRGEPGSFTSRLSLPERATNTSRLTRGVR